MRVTVEMSLYPLAPQPIDKILAFIDTVRNWSYDRAAATAGQTGE